MVIQSNIRFVENATTPIVSKPFFNSTGDILTLQIYGSDGVYHLEGRMKDGADWVSLAGINLNNFTTIKNGFKEAGIYEMSVIGIR